MSNAEQAWKEWSKERVEQRDLLFYSTSAQAFMQYGFLAGYTRGRADAWDLPEVRAEELEEEKFYVTEADSGKTVVGVVIAQQFFGVDSDGLPYKIPANWFDSFRGPLRVGEGK